MSTGTLIVCLLAAGLLVWLLRVLTPRVGGWYFDCQHDQRRLPLWPYLMGRK
jgi:hypothetical protein